MPGVRRCGHCRNEGHNRTNCTKLQVDTVLNIHGRHQERYSTPLRQYLKLSKINLDRLAQVRLLIDGQIPYMVFKRLCTSPEFNNFIVRQVNNKFTVTIEEPNQEMENIAKNAIIENAETIANYKNNYRERIQHVKDNLRYAEYQNINNTITILNGDHIEFAIHVGAEQRAREAAYQQHLVERRNMENNANEFINRELLPIIRDTPVEAVDCPICLESFGETGKSILRCGHQVCINCIVTQTLRCAAIKSIRQCICPVCRTPYV
jgi:hypothetical protein